MLSQEDIPPVCAIICVNSVCQYYFQLASGSVIWKLSMCLTVYWIYPEVYKAI